MKRAARVLAMAGFLFLVTQTMGQVMIELEHPISRLKWTVLIWWYQL